MKNIIMKLFTILAVVSAFSQNVATFAAEPANEDASDITVYVNGEIVTFPDQNPVNHRGRLLVPARTIFEGMGFNVSWEDELKTIIMTDENVVVKIRDGDSVFFVNETVVVLDVPAKVVGGRMMLPLRAISESIGANVASSDELKMVSIFHI